MPKTGNKRIPKKIKIIRGTFRKDRAPEKEPDFTKVEEIPRPPSYMSKHGKKLWKRLVKELTEKGVLAAVDLPGFEMMCEAYGMFREAQEIVHKILIDPGTGKKRRQTLDEYMKGRTSHSAGEVVVMRQMWQVFRLYLLEFGMTPSSRAKIDVPAPGEKEKDIIQQMLDGER